MECDLIEHSTVIMDFGDKQYRVPRGCMEKIREAVNNREERIGYLMDVVEEARKVLADFDRADGSVLDKTEWAGMRTALAMIDDFMSR